MHIYAKCYYGWLPACYLICGEGLVPTRRGHHPLIGMRLQSTSGNQRRQSTSHTGNQRATMAINEPKGNQRRHEAREE